MLRTGADYRESLRDGRRVWVMGEGLVEDVTTHPATKAMVDEYVAWYDRHLDPEWQDVVLTPPDHPSGRIPCAFVLPKSADDLRRMGRCFSATIALSAGNITHTPAYGNLIALGILDSVQSRKLPQDQIDQAAKYRDMIASTGRFLTFSSGGATIGYRFREDPDARVALRVVRERDDGVVISGKVGMHTSPAFAEEVYIGGTTVINPERRGAFLVPVNSPGVTVACRKRAAHHANPFVAPLSSRFDELDGQLYFEEVFIPWERIVTTDPPTEPGQQPVGGWRRRDGIASWLFWHQAYCWLSKCDFILGVALACAEAMGLKEEARTQEYLVDLICEAQMGRTALTAAELDPEWSPGGYAIPNQLHVASASLQILRARQRMGEILRILPGSSMVVAPADTDIADERIKSDLEDAFGGGGYMATQRAALLNLAWDLISSGLDGRESAFELHANGGVPAWRERMRRFFDRYNQLANAVLKMLPVEMPAVDIESFREIQRTPRRQVTPRSETSAAENGASAADAPARATPQQA
jgi:4-hydroxyphenylacetate 3-monooxygenase